MTAIEVDAVADEVIKDADLATGLIEALKKAADPDKIWSTNAMAKLTVRFKGGTYKKTAIAEGDPPLTLAGVRAGKRAIIFEFEPVDTRPYEAIEMDETQAPQMLPGFAAHVCAALGAPEAPTIKAARARWRNTRRKEIAQAAEEAREAQARKSAATNANNPLWGAFA